MADRDIGRLEISRRVGERVQIGVGPDKGWVKVVEISRDRTRLAFYFPRSKKILRSELVTPNHGGGP